MHILPDVPTLSLLRVVRDIMKPVRAYLKNAYFYVVTLPERLYPFKANIGGEWVRGRRAYEKALRAALRRHGIGKIGYKLLLYREVFHFVGSIVFIISATLISNELFGSDKALYVLMGAAVLALGFQEFYVHPRTYGQRPQKGVLDWLSWVIPMVVYAFLIR